MKLVHDPLVLMYHGFARIAPAHDPYCLVVARDRFAEQLAVLCRGERMAVGLEGYLGAVASPRRPRRVLVTIDDGYQSVADIAAPMLAEAGVPALLFVPPGRLGESSSWMDDFADEPLMDADTLRRMPAFGIEVGCHGWDHTVMVGLSDAELRRHTVEARDALADLTGSVPRAFAYPEGRYDRRSLEAVRDAGFEVAFSVHDDEGRFAISRVDVNSTDTPSTFRIKMVPGYRRLWRLANRATVVRRTVRRVAQRV